jgi:hypothetical protein
VDRQVRVLGPMWKVCFLFVILSSFRLISYCGRLFDCGSHKCQQSCHPPSCRPAPCPSSPSKITHCPCGKRPIRHSPTAATVLTAFPPRSHCTSPIPTCTSSCDKLHASCGHPCGATCHTGPCPPCSFSMVRPCRCGGTTRTVRCYELRPPDGGDIDDEIMEILCEKPCAAVRTCGRHQCRRPCCPLASLASTTGKKGKRRPGAELDVGEEQGGLHECDLICGKVLSCGDHRCEEKDHKGACPPCLRSSFEEVCFFKSYPFVLRLVSDMIHARRYVIADVLSLSLRSHAGRRFSASTNAHVLLLLVDIPARNIHVTRGHRCVRPVRSWRRRGVHVERRW